MNDNLERWDFMKKILRFWDKKIDAEKDRLKLLNFKIFHLEN